MRTGTEPPAPGTDDAKARLEMVAVAGLIGIGAAVVFVGWPQLDVTVSGYFHLGPRNFALRHSELAETIREGFKFLNLTSGILVVLAIAAVIAHGRRFLSLGLAHWGFLALVLIIGPGLLANSTLKDNWGRPRPIQITEFGGPGAFAPALARTGAVSAGHAIRRQAASPAAVERG
jgi:lipid A 4'-phosphatase